MNILFFSTNTFIESELEEFTGNMNSKAYFAASVEEAVMLLNHHVIDVLYLELRGIADVGLLKYTADNFKNIRIIIMVSNSIGHAISVIRNSEFDLLQAPLRLKDLRNVLSEYV